MSNETEKAKGLKDNEVGQSEVDGVVSLVAHWRERAELAWKIKEDRCGGKISPEGNDYAMHATTLEMCADELERATKG